jgi:hypothetical protein
MPDCDAFVNVTSVPDTSPTSPSIGLYDVRTAVIVYDGFVADTAELVGFTTTGNVAPDCESGHSVVSTEPAALQPGAVRRTERRRLRLVEAGFDGDA